MHKLFIVGFMKVRLSLIGFMGLVLLAHSAFVRSTESTQVQNTLAELPHCVTQQEQREIRGQSMKGVLDAGDQILVLRNYYDCRPVERGDWVVFRYSGTLGKNMAIIKQVAGVPGDTLGSEPVENKAVSAIIINGDSVKSPDGKPYYLNKVGASYLGLALRQTRNGVIPRGRYWVLGTAYADGWDSRRFGFIPHQDLMGKAVPRPLR